MRRPILLAILLAASAAAVSPVSAQRAQRDRGIVELEPAGVRGGFYATLGIGAGREQFKFSDDLEFSEALTKPTITIRLGGTPNPSTRVGAELFGWANDVDEGTESFAAFLLSAQVYPVKTNGLYLKAGGGFARSGIDYNNGSSTTESGFAWSAGAGFDLPLSRSVALGPTVDFYQGSFTRRNEPTLTERVLNIGVQVTFQTGGRNR
jgi:hypothetical protein